MTACRDCKNLHRHGDSLYDRTCIKYPITEFNPYSGEIRSIGYKLIRDVNFGNCKDFELLEKKPAV